MKVKIASDPHGGGLLVAAGFGLRFGIALLPVLPGRKSER
jgi:hypothetical protein